MSDGRTVQLALIAREASEVRALLRYAQGRPYVLIQVRHPDGGRESSVAFRIGELADLAAAFGLAARIVAGTKRGRADG